jgi:hypothetical protein
VTGRIEEMAKITLVELVMPKSSNAMSAISWGMPRYKVPRGTKIKVIAEVPDDCMMDFAILDGDSLIKTLEEDNDGTCEN